MSHGVTVSPARRTDPAQGAAMRTLEIVGLSLVSAASRCCSARTST
jgi:hypothetical protein